MTKPGGELPEVFQRARTTYPAESFQDTFLLFASFASSLMGQQLLKEALLSKGKWK